jgi:hypothetical protein
MKRHSGTGVSARSKGVKMHTSGALESWGGIVSGHVSDYAEALGCTSADILEVAEQVDLLFDTAESKKTRGDDPGRPTDSTLRCLGMTEDRFQALRRRVKDAQAEQDASTDVSVTH